jgi:ribonuclease T1
VGAHGALWRALVALAVFCFSVGFAFSADIRVGELPIEARATLELIQAGGPFPYQQDGRVFGNREGLLPKRSRGYYREYTVRTPGVRDRGARRIVAGAAGEYYYTDDHYRSFKRILE